MNLDFSLISMIASHLYGESLRYHYTALSITAYTPSMRRLIIQWQSTVNRHTLEINL